MAAWLESILRHLKYAARSLAKTPAFTATVILTLALGIGANSAVFSAIFAVLLRSLPFPNGDELVELAQLQPHLNEPFVAPVRLEEWNRLNNTFQAISGYYTEDDSELSGGLPENVKRAFVAPRFLQVWGVAPALGRDFGPAEEHYGGPTAVLISDRFWRRRFGGNPNAVGKALRFGRTSYTIAGVMPASFLFPDRSVDLWSPSPPDAPFALSREATWFRTIGRLRPGVTLEQARADMAAVQAGLGRQFPKPDAQIRPELRMLKDVTIGGVRRSLWILFGSVTLLLLIACTNIAALLMSRAANRRHETSIRFSLGASRASVAAQFFTEVLVLSLGGAALGLLVASAASNVFHGLARNLPRVDEISLNWKVVLYSAGCAIAVTLLCGIFPAVRGARRSPADSLAHGGRSLVSGRNPMQFVLVGVQVALAVTLLAGAGLLLRSLEQLGRVSPGFNPQNVLAFHISTSWGETADPKAARQWAKRILDGLRSLPGVEAAATSLGLPGLPGQYQIELKTTEGRGESEPKLLAESRWVTPGYFATLRIPLIAGELCRNEPNTATIMVNRSFASKYFNGADAIGRRLVDPGNSYLPPAVIRGIVGDARETGLDREPPPAAYWCLAATQPGTFFLVRTNAERNSLAAAIRRKIHQLEPQRSVYDLVPLTDRISDAYAENRLRTILLSFFALTAVSLACVGLYGTLSYMVNVRHREVALRLALGAMRAQVVGQFLGQGLGVALAGCLVGLGLAAASRRLLSGMLYGVSGTDAATLGGVTILVLGVSALSSLLPAFRAARVEPMRALREE